MNHLSQNHWEPISLVFIKCKKSLHAQASYSIESVSNSIIQELQPCIAKCKITLLACTFQLQIVQKHHRYNLVLNIVLYLFYDDKETHYFNLYKSCFINDGARVSILCTRRKPTL